MIEDDRMYIVKDEEGNYYGYETVADLEFYTLDSPEFDGCPVMEIKFTPDFRIQYNPSRPASIKLIHYYDTPHKSPCESH